MQYSTPELIVLGPAPALVLGSIAGRGDNVTSLTSKPEPEFALGLDD